MATKFFPLFMDISEFKVLVVGGGAVATRRVRTLLSFAENIQVIAPCVSSELENLKVEKRIAITNREFEVKDLEGVDLVIGVTDDETVNDRIYILAKAQGILVNHGGNKKKCDFYFPAIVEEDNLVIGITASGEDHSQVKRVAKNIRGHLKDLVGGDD